LRTFRRTFLDDALERHRNLFRGRVLDLGGKKAQKRGKFRPDGSPAESWQYLNIDPASEPDFLSAADEIPVADGHFDTVLMTELVEHLADPEAVLFEVQRVLRPGGTVVATMPFLFPVHGDPDDYQRWTPEKLRAAFAEAGLPAESVSPMGSAAAVVFDVCWITWCAYVQRLPVILHRFTSAPFLLVKPLFALVDARLTRVRQRITTGYLIVARKAPSDPPAA
jgi:SAM-dependent methyltransferase